MRTKAVCFLAVVCLVFVFLLPRQLFSQADDCGGFFSPWAPGIHQRHVTTGSCANSATGPFDFSGNASQGWCKFDEGGTLRGEDMKCFSAGCTLDVVTFCGGWKVGNLSCMNSYNGAPPRVGTESMPHARADGSQTTTTLWMCITVDSPTEGHGQQCQCIAGDNTHLSEWGCGTTTVR